MNVSGIGCARTSLIVFFQKQEKVFVRVPNDLKCYENRDLTCLNHRLVLNVLKKQGENERERECEYMTRVPVPPSGALRGSEGKRGALRGWGP